MKRQLNEIEAGDFDGMTYEDVAEMHPVEFADRDADKLRYRYPNGESYVDVCRFDFFVLNTVIVTGTFEMISSLRVL